MPGATRIEWTESSWNPVTGCTKVSEGCRNCYAERLAQRLCRIGLSAYRNGFEVTLHPDVLPVPLSWKKPRYIFVNSMSDLFHEHVPSGFILDVFEVMKRAEWHTFQVLTKRPDRLIELDSSLEWAPNIWMGVTVESSEHLCRLDCLRRTGAKVRFVSFEPLLGHITDADLHGIDWAIVGGESGSGARRMEAEWALALRDACICEGVPFFFKQWGGSRRKAAGRLLDGRIWDEMPRGDRWIGCS